MIYEWDEEKNHSNYMKHWVRFEEAREIWMDEYALEFYDTDNSISEDRFVRIGFNKLRGLLTVIFCERESGNVLRIISARRATKRERGVYERRV